MQLYEKKNRKWYCQRGKGDVLKFTDDEIRKLKECFSALDDDGSGSIGIDELEEPLIGLGFADTREEVLDMIMSVDDDGSGMIEFPEFLEIIKNSDANEKTAKINKFFKDMSNGTLGKNDSMKDLSFNLIVQTMRRQYMMDAILGKGDQKEDGMRILTNVGRQVQYAKMKAKEKDENGSDCSESDD
uniref:Calmodulin n=1 Tax=Strombidium inclinatum TaxID=197538 RepID=A0A7S3IM21_9SPIT|mmetsp:Transcript_27394/g.41668  ORF Transcript_27394/g.41668 Transcript_27394/m.41668 type:complete len:186 (+) Transcript_27394:593-1150(+)